MLYHRARWVESPAAGLMSRETTTCFVDDGALTEARPYLNPQCPVQERDKQASRPNCVIDRVKHGCIME